MNCVRTALYNIYLMIAKFRSNIGGELILSAINEVMNTVLLKLAFDII